MPLFVSADLDGLVFGSIRDFNRIGGLGIVCHSGLITRGLKGLGNRGALFFKRYRGIELRGVKRHGAVNGLLGLVRRRRLDNIRGCRLLGLKRRRSFGSVDGRGLLGLVLFELLRRTLTLCLGCLLLSDSLLLGSLACDGALFLKVVDEFLALCKCTLKEAGSTGPNRREGGCNIGMRRRRGNLGRKIGIALVRHASRLLGIIIVRLVHNVLRRRGGCQNVQSRCGIDRRYSLGLRNGRRSHSGPVVHNGGGRRCIRDGDRLGLECRLLALLVIERTGLGKHAECTDGIRTKADVAGGIAIELRLRLAGLDHNRLLRRLGSGNLGSRLFDLDSLALCFGHNGADQRLVGRCTLKAIDLLVEGLALFRLELIIGSDRLTELVLLVGRLFVLDGVAIVVLLLGRGIFRRRTCHLLGATFLLTKIGVERNVVGELIFALEGGDIVHNAKQSGDRRFVTHRAGRIGKDVAIGDDVCRVGERNERGENRDDPQQNLERAGKRQDAQDGDGSGGNRGDGQQLSDERAVRSIGLASEQLGARGIVMRNNDHRAVTRGRERARSLVIGDDILAHTRLSQPRDHGMPGTLEHIEHGTDDGQ